MTRTTTRSATARRIIPMLASAALVFAACGSDDAAAPGTQVDDQDDPSVSEVIDPASTDAPIETEGDVRPDVSAECSDTIDDGVLTIATGNPAFFPWVIDDMPETGQGFEAAVALAVAREMGYEGDAVKWVRTDFDAAIQPGAKDFDFNLQQFSITPERLETVDFSLPYFTSNQAIVALNGSTAEGATSIAELKDVKFGAQAGTTSLSFINDVIQPNQDVFVYDDNVGAKAALEANQIDAAVFDLPTALYVSGVEIDGSSVTGQFPASAGGTTDQFGLVLEKDSDLTPCVDAAITAITATGELEAITNEWLSDFTGAPIISE